MSLCLGKCASAAFPETLTDVILEIETAQGKGTSIMYSSGGMG